MLTVNLVCVILKTNKGGGQMNDMNEEMIYCWNKLRELCTGMKNCSLFNVYYCKDIDAPCNLEKVEI